MSKKLIVAAAVGCTACAILALRNRQAGAEGGGRPTMWEKMGQFMDEMPEDFPPRIMFDNLAVARQNTERILEILEEREAPSEGEADEV